MADESNICDASVAVAHNARWSERALASARMREALESTSHPQGSLEQAGFLGVCQSFALRYQVLTFN